MSDDSRKHEFEILIDAPADEVWRAITEGEQIQQWFAPEARVADGRLFLSWGPGMEGSAPITTWEPGKRVGWTEQHDNASPRIVEFTLETEGGKTKLRLVHSGFGKGASFDDEYESTHGGWLTFLAALRYLAERRGDKRGRHLWKLSMQPCSPDDLWQRLTAALGLASQDWTPGAPYHAEFPGGSFHGTVIAAPKPGYALLRVEELDGSLLALFVERGGGQCCFTTSWYLYGTAATGDQPLLDQWNRFYASLSNAVPAP